MMTCRTYTITGPVQMMNNPSDGNMQQIENAPARAHKVVYLENPMPEPVMHKHISMDFPLQNDREYDDFDIQISDSDDFDL